MSSIHIKYWFRNILPLVLIMVAFAPINVRADYQATFVVSAYYSPLPGQDAYVTGSYAGDIRLNGGGVRTASGVLVEDAPGCFLASPPEYPFGTIVELDGIGQCVILDRGGAFKNGLLRLDMWAGYGDEGRVTAMSWGLRRVQVNILGEIESPNLANGYNNYSDLESYQNELSERPLVFADSLEVGDEGEDVARLQQLLKDLKFFNSEVSGIFDDDTKTAINMFQLEQGLLTGENLSESGRFGSFTIERLNEKVARTRDEYFEYVPSRNLGRGARGDDVRKLQNLLYKLGYIDSVSGLYDSGTVKAVMQFQIDQGIILDSKDQAAGYFGPNTQYALDRVFFLMENNVLDDIRNTETDEDLSFSNVETADLLTFALEEGDSGEPVTQLQDILISINYLRIDPTGYYGPLTTHAVYKFQQRVGIVSSKSDPGAGIVGPKTRIALNKFLDKKNSVTAQYTGKTDTALVYDFEEGLSLGDRGENVKVLQAFLRDNGYFKGSLVTEYYGEVTKNSLIAYQKDNNLPGSGKLDLPTIKLLRSRS